ncbi:hypothetical protein [Bacillus sp. JJ722]|uniref:hypothetical protein n=1 Tax=Bacillus sp. JJ722 TaxID=3122973 RepID=UPI002FFFEF02
MFEITKRYNCNHVKKLETLIRDIRQDVYEELKNELVTIKDVEKCLKSNIAKQKNRLTERKRNKSLTKLKIDYLDQISTTTEMKNQAEYILFEITLNNDE